MLTVILPAAGKGARLNLPYPKEILKVNKDQALIDFSFDHFRNYGRVDVQFVVVINENKLDIVKYLSRYKDRYNISFVYQNPYELEYVGAIKSASHLFTEHNLVLLPDSVLTMHYNCDLYKNTTSLLEKKGAMFVCMKESNSDMLKTKGALTVKDYKTTAYCDKPTENLDTYNAYWCAFGFTKYAADSMLDYMHRSTLQLPQMQEFTNSKLSDAAILYAEDYRDLGTWPELQRLMSE